MSKKGVEWGMSITAKLILALAFTAIGLLLIRELSHSMIKGYDKQGCKASVVYNAKFRIPVVEREELSVDCPTRYVTITPKEIIMEVRGREVKEKIRCGNLDSEKEKKCFLKKVNKQIASIIFDCWDQFAAGQLPVFSRYESGRQCILCSRVEFSQEVRSKFSDVGDQEVGWIYTAEPDERGQADYPLDEYMRTHKPLTHEISYYEFTLDKIDAFNPPYYDYNFVKPRAAVFVALNEDQAKYLLGKTWDKVKSVFTDSEDNKEYNYVNTLEWVPYDEVATRCDVLV